MYILWYFLQTMDEHEQAFWYSEKFRRRQIKLEKQSVVDLQIRNLNRKITATSKTLPGGELGKVFHYITVDKPKKRLSKFYCQYPTCKRKYTEMSPLLKHERTCSNNAFQTTYPCDICNITTLTEDGFNIHKARFHPEIHIAEKSHFGKI